MELWKLKKEQHQQVKPWEGDNQRMQTPKSQIGGEEAAGEPIMGRVPRWTSGSSERRIHEESRRPVKQKKTQINLEQLEVLVREG